MSLGSSPWTPSTLDHQLITRLLSIKAEILCIESSVRAKFDKKRALSFVGFRPLDKNLLSLVASSKRPRSVMTDSYESGIVSATQLSGRWRKNKNLSEDTAKLYDYASLPWLLRRGERFLRFLEIESDEKHFRRTINAGGFLNFSEVYPWDGTMVKMRRRDQRRGKMEGKVEQIPNGVRTSVSWNDPYGLHMEDRFCLSDNGDELTILTSAKRQSCEEHVTVKQVFFKI